MGRRKKGGKVFKPRDQIEDSDKNNVQFNTYYKAQNIVPEDQWDPMLESFRASLPTSFRLAGSRLTAKSLNASILSHYVPSLMDVEYDGEKVPPPSQIPWYPDGLAWQFNVPKKVLRKQPEFKRFHSFLVYETDGGNISRQETVSMIPPLFLDVQPHHKVLDMCAAPGSKTAQLLEALHINDNPTTPAIPTGVVIANDSDYKRTHMLIHQAGRLPSPCFMVTNVDAGHYPGMKIPVPGSPPEKNLSQPLLFDRILCDVPCSGDGTLRKNNTIWKTWSPQDGNGLHSLQLRILLRGMRLLAPGGRLVYSTCSLNPIENEAVVAEALRVNTAFQLVDVSSTLPGLKRQPGLSTWLPAVNRGVDLSYGSFQDFKKNGPTSDVVRSKLTTGHWPPLENIEALNLSRCMRVYPHLQDTGGFFVAVFERTVDIVKPGADEDVEETTKIGSGLKRGADEDPDETTEAKKIKLAETPADSIPSTVASTMSAEAAAAGPTSSFKEDPYTYLSPDDPVLGYCKDRLHLTAQFPCSTVLVRNPTGAAVRSAYLTNELVKTIAQNNDYTKIRLTAAGTKILVKQEAGRGYDAQFRILGEGLPVVLPFLEPDSIATTELATLRTLLSSYYPLFTTFTEGFQNILTSKPSGSLIIRIPREEFLDPSLLEDVVVPLWKSQVSISLMIDKKAKSAMSLRLFGEDITVRKEDEALVRGVDNTGDVEVDVDMEHAATDVILEKEELPVVEVVKTEA